MAGYVHAIAYTSKRNSNNNGMPPKKIKHNENGELLDIVLGKIMHVPCHAIKEPEVNNANNVVDIENGEVSLSRKMQFRCLVIEEPEANNESIEAKEAYIAAIVARYSQKWLERSKHNLGYQLNMDFHYRVLDPLQQFSVNNFGDPFIEGIYGIHSRDFEVGVLDWFAELWGIGKDEYWGYVTNGGTEGNLHGLLVGREVLPDGILYTSEESHYSIFKVAHMYRMNCIKIRTLTSGEMNCEDLKIKLLQNKDKPAIININIGTTIKGAIDDLDLVLQTLEKCSFSENRFYIHCDGATSGIILPFLSRGPQITFKKPIGSMSVSGHKFIGCPMPCGIEIVRKKHINSISRDVEYVVSRDATITGSRNGHAPIFLWYNLSIKGHNGLKKEVQKSIGLAQYLKDRLREAKISAMHNELSNFVVFERPRDAEFLRRWQLAPQGNISHVCVMPHVTKEMLDTFVDELVEKRLNWFKDCEYQPPCVASEIGKENCACPQHIMK